MCMKKQCCDYSIQNHAKVVSVLNLVKALLLFEFFEKHYLDFVWQLGAVLALIYGGSKIPKLPKLYSSIDQDDDHLSIDEINVAAQELLVSSLAHVTYGIFAIVCAALAIESAWNNHKPKLLIPWLLINALSIVASIVAIVVMKPLDPNYPKTMCYILFAGSIIHWYVIPSSHVGEWAFLRGSLQWWRRIFGALSWASIGN